MAQQSWVAGETERHPKLRSYPHRMAFSRTCIICDKPAGSGEHIFPASLGGRRTNKGIYCTKHDGGFSPLVNALATQLRMLNGQLEIVNDHRKREGFVPPTIEAADGATYAIAGGALVPQRARVVGRTVGPDGIEQLQLAVPEGLVGRLNELARNGDIEIRARGEPEPAVQSDSIHFQLEFGGARFLAGVAYVAMSYLAKFHPDLARQQGAGLAGLKANLLAAASEREDQKVEMPNCVWWETPEVLAGLPPSPFRFSHTIVISTDSSRRRAGAYLCLFGTFCFGVDFGEFDAGVVDGTRVVHLNPQAPHPPDDQQELPPLSTGLAITAPTPSATENLRKALEDGTAQKYVALFLVRARDWQIEGSAQKLVDAISSLPVDRLHTSAGRQVVHQLMEQHNQQVYGLMCEFVGRLPPHLGPIAPLLQSFVARDGAKPMGLTDLAASNLYVAKAFLAEAFAAEALAGTLTLEKAKRLLAGTDGVAVVGEAMITPIREVVAQGRE